MFQKIPPLCAVFPLFSIVFLTNIEAVANTLSHRARSGRGDEKQIKSKTGHLVKVADTVTDEASPGVGDKSRSIL